MGEHAQRKTIGSRLSRAGLFVLRWKMETPPPTITRAVILAGPHTSNVDGLLLVLLTRSAHMTSSWMVKDVWTKPPIGWLINRLGAVPVNRKQASGMVAQMVAQFDAREEFQLLIPPEGTRSHTEYWKSGFYRIALDAGVPVIPSYLDYSRKRAGFGEPISLTGDKRVDMDTIRLAYANGSTMARFPAKFGPVRLPDEEVRDDAGTDSANDSTGDGVTPS